MKAEMSVSLQVNPEREKLKEMMCEGQKEQKRSTETKWKSKNQIKKENAFISLKILEDS